MSSEIGETNMDLEAAIQETGAHIERAIRDAGPMIQQGFDEMVRYNAAVAHTHLVMGVCFLAAGALALLLFAYFLYRGYRNPDREFWTGMSIVSGIACFVMLLSGMGLVSGNLPVYQAPTGYTIKHDLMKSWD
jgi:hypothetical protein